MRREPVPRAQRRTLGHPALDQAGLTELLEPLAHHPFGDAGHGPHHVGETGWSVRQSGQDRERPALAYQAEHAKLALATAEAVRLGFQSPPRGYVNARADGM